MPVEAAPCFEPGRTPEHGARKILTDLVSFSESENDKGNDVLRTAECLSMCVLRWLGLGNVDPKLGR